MQMPFRILMLAALALGPTGCDWCQLPDVHSLRAQGVVRDAAGAELGTATVTLGWSEDQPSSGWFSVEMVGPAALADSARAGWPAGGPLQGWTGAVRLESAAGDTLFASLPRRGSLRAVFEHVGGRATGDQLRALRASLMSRRTVIVIETIDDPLVPLPGPVRATLPQVTSSRSEGGCT